MDGTRSLIIHTYKYPRPAVAADLVIVYQDELLVIKRNENSEAFPGVLALPGGFLDMHETIEQAAVRELKEETGIDLDELDLSLIDVYSGVNRDPRQRTIGVAFYHTFPVKPIVQAGDDAAECHWISIDDVIKSRIELAFDHNKIVQDFTLK